MTVIIWAAGAVPVTRPSRLIEHLALMSFSMFLTNEVTRIVWFGLLDALGQDALSSGVRWILWAVGFVGAFVAAAVFRYGFDRPVQVWLNPSSAASNRERIGIEADPSTPAVRPKLHMTGRGLSPAKYRAQHGGHPHQADFSRGADGGDGRTVEGNEAD